jgi:hypothetical protein
LQLGKGINKHVQSLYNQAGRGHTCPAVTKMIDPHTVSICDLTPLDATNGHMTAPCHHSSAPQKHPHLNNTELLMLRCVAYHGNICTYRKHLTATWCTAINANHKLQVSRQQGWQSQAVCHRLNGSSRHASWHHDGLDMGNKAGQAKPQAQQRAYPAAHIMVQTPIQRKPQFLHTIAHITLAGP